MYRSNRNVYQRACIKVFRVVLFAIVKRKENNINLQKHGKIEVYIYLNIPSSEFHHLLPHSKFPHTFPYSEFHLTYLLSEFPHSSFKIPCSLLFQNSLTLLLSECPHTLCHSKLPLKPFSSQNSLTPSLTQIPHIPSLRIPSLSSYNFSLSFSQNFLSLSFLHKSLLPFFSEFPLTLLKFPITPSLRIPSQFPLTVILRISSHSPSLTFPPSSTPQSEYHHTLPHTEFPHSFPD